jgi:8-oxo-dGTP diphosphatase
MRRYGEPAQKGVRYIDRPGAYGVVLKGGKALLSLNISPGEEVALPGGGIDPGESPTRALHREAIEETGHRIHIERRIGAYQRFTYMPEYDLWAHKICNIYLCRAGRYVTAPTPPDRPLWIEAHAAADILSIDGDRDMFLAGMRLAGIL